jgi:citrate lyase subunit beta/citryl-CoA lyase
VSLDLSRSERIAAARTFLFVPGDRPERFDKAVSAGADIVIVDLEDAVAPAHKEQARAALAAWLSEEHPIMVRVNAYATPWFVEDLKLCEQPAVLGMVPKAEAGPVLDGIAQAAPTIPIIESARGIETVSGIAATGGVVRLAFGTIDLALDLETDSELVLQILGTRLVTASRACGLAAPIDGPTRIFKDAEPVREAMRDARARGFGAKLCIHPAQIAPVLAALKPTAMQIEAARRIVEADRNSGGQAVAVDGQMVDKPVVDRAYRLLQQADLVEAVGAEYSLDAKFPNHHC